MSNVLKQEPPEYSDEMTAGISEEDQKQIILQIDRVVAENRINVDQDIFRLNPEKKSIVFPIMVNISAVVVLALGIALLAWLFRAEEQQLIEARRVVPATESLLIDEIRREAERELAEKDQEIQEIEARLAAIANERSAIESDVQNQIAAREQELRQEFEAELEAERQRLQALNLSDEDLAAQLAAFEAQRQQELEAQLNQFRAEALAEQERLERELARAEQEFNQNLTAANQERLALEQENQQRLAAIQRELETQQAAGQAQLSAAQAELRMLSEQAQRERIIRTQITGFFSGIAQAINTGNLPLARSRITDLRRLLNEESTLRIEPLREQQPSNLALVQSLENYVNLLERIAEDDSQAILQQQIQELEATLEEDRLQITTLESSLLDANQQITELLESISLLSDNLQSETELAQANANLVTQLNNTLATTELELETARRQIAELQMTPAQDGTGPVPAEIREELARLEALEQNLVNARREFEEYQRGATNILTARAAFNRFLGSSAMTSLLPGLQAEVNRFEERFVESGRENALLEMADLVMELSMINNPQQRINDVQRRIQSAPANSALWSFLMDLQVLLEES